MTKADLIEWLEPFADDTPIVVLRGGLWFDPVQPQYRVYTMSESDRATAAPALNLLPGDGFIVING